MNIIVINGPNLAELGRRESNIYGNFTLQELEQKIQESKQNNTQITFFQSDSEPEIIKYIHTLKDKSIKGIVLNAAALTHTSIALRDALLTSQIPFIEVHISNVYKREEFRHQSFLRDIAIGVVCGMGIYSYLTALQYFENN